MILTPARVASSGYIAGHQVTLKSTLLMCRVLWWLVSDKISRFFERNKLLVALGGYVAFRIFEWPNNIGALTGQASSVESAHMLVIFVENSNWRLDNGSLPFHSWKLSNSALSPRATLRRRTIKIFRLISLCYWPCVERWGVVCTTCNFRWY